VRQEKISFLVRSGAGGTEKQNTTIVIFCRNRKPQSGEAFVLLL